MEYVTNCVCNTGVAHLTTELLFDDLIVEQIGRYASYLFVYISKILEIHFKFGVNLYISLCYLS